MSRHTPDLDWIDAQRDRMVRLLVEWASINSASDNLPGLAAVAAALREAYAGLGGEAREIDLPPYERIDASGLPVAVPVGKAISITKRSAAPLRVFLGIHMDTVYPSDSPFRKVETLGGKLHGPAVADAKGGLAVMLVALEALERSRHAEKIGWEVLVNPDEEIGSPSSAAFLAEAAGRNHLGLLFEPAMDEAGSLAGSRRGSGSFAVVIRGRSAHAGRDIARGRNAVVAAAELAVALQELHAPERGVTLNVGRIEGGSAVNVVPDLAIVRFNVRVTEAAQAQAVTRRVGEMVKRIDEREGFAAEPFGKFLSPPKPWTPAMRRLFDHTAACGRELGLTLGWKESGGVSDGNKLAAAGLPNIDSLGVRGGAIHSHQEFMVIDSLTERAKLTAMLLMKLASGELPWHEPPPVSR